MLLLLRFLERYHGEGHLGKLILVAGFAVPANPEHHQYFAPTLDFNKIRTRARAIYSVYSDNDRVVLPSQTRWLNDQLDGELILDPGKGHFAGLKGVNELPSVLKIILDNS